MDAQEMMIEALEERFGHVDSKVKDQIKGITSRDVLKKLFRQALRIRELEEFKEAINQVVNKP